MGKILFCLALTVCLLSNAQVATAKDERRPAAIINEGGGFLEDEALNEFIKENNKALSSQEEQDESSDLVIPIEINNRVASWIRYMTIKDRARTIRHFTRGSRYKVHIEEMLEKHDVPKEIFYLALIESGFVQRARSKAQAVGVWQMVRGTGANYGLAINRYVDERQNWIKSTESAITYLKDLKNVFGSWYLAFAAYNAGEYQIVRSIMKGKSRDFWALAEGKFLPQETLNYVPKFMAAMIIGKDPAKYNIVFEEQEPYEDFEAVMVPSGIGLKTLSRITKVPVKTIEEWNPDILRGVVPWGAGGRFEMYLPEDQAEMVAEKESVIARHKKRNRRIEKYTRKGRSGGYRIYVVKPGDTLIGISRMLGVKVRTLKKINRIQRSRIHVGQRLKYYVNLSVSKQKKARDVASKAPQNSPRIHLVQEGQSIYLVAEDYGASVDDIMEWNDLEGLDLEEGKKIVVAK